MFLSPAGDGEWKCESIPKPWISRHPSPLATNEGNAGKLGFEKVAEHMLEQLAWQSLGGEKGQKSEERI